MFKGILSVLLVLAAVGCTSPNVDVKPVQFGESTGIVSGGTLRLVTERPRGVGFPKVVCTEPSPDYATAFNNTRKVTIAVPSKTAVDRKADVDFSTSEIVGEGSGRAEAILALRDGLYTACQSYANGVLGQDSYAIILSQYGGLLTTLIAKSSDAGKPATTAPAPSPGQSTLAALVVACISSHDKSRSMYDRNIMLDQPFCSRVLNRALAVATR
jgi:hypothetical protein